MTEPHSCKIPRQGIILIICGPAGSGKTTLCDQLLENYHDLQRVITATTRAPRDGEQNGIDYHFFSPESFEKKIKQDAFYEYARVHGRHYGTLKSEVQKLIDSGKDVILNIDIQGADSFRREATNDPELAKSLTTIFIRPDCIETIRERLRGRQSDSEEEIERRMQTAIEELKTADQFDYIIPTTTKEADYQLMSAIYQSEKHRIVK